MRQKSSHRTATLLLALVALLLAGCGNKGALVLPDQAPGAGTPAATPVPPAGAASGLSSGLSDTPPATPRAD
jgi:predicted small lipoprotein YifL